MKGDLASASAWMVGSICPLTSARTWLMAKAGLRFDVGACLPVRGTG